MAMTTCFVKRKLRRCS